MNKDVLFQISGVKLYEDLTRLSREFPPSTGGGMNRPLYFPFRENNSGMT